MQVWQSDTAFVLKQARQVGDSVSGRVAERPDLPALTISLSKVDSIRTRRMDLGKTFLAVTGLGVAAIMAVGLAIASAGQADT